MLIAPEATAQSTLPLWLPGGQPQPNEGGNVCFRGVQDSGKTLGMLRFGFRLVQEYGFTWEDVVGNFRIWQDKKNNIPMPGYTFMDNEKLKKYIRKVYRKAKGTIRHKIIMIDEIDQCYSHKFSASDVEAIQDLLTLWQDKKLGIYFLYTKHIGFGCNILIRQATEVSMKPLFDRVHDTLYLQVLDGFTMQVKWLKFDNISRYFNFYDRWDFIY